MTHTIDSHQILRRPRKLRLWELDKIAWTEYTKELFENERLLDEVATCSPVPAAKLGKLQDALFNTVCKVALRLTKDAADILSGASREGASGGGIDHRSTRAKLNGDLTRWTGFCEAATQGDADHWWFATKERGGRRSPFKLRELKSVLLDTTLSAAQRRERIIELCT